MKRLFFSLLLLATLSACDTGFDYEEEGPPDREIGMSVTAFLESRPDLFTSLVAAIDQAGLRGTLDETNGYSLVAPTDDAFARYLGDGALTDVDPDTLADLLRYHVIPQVVLGEDLPTTNTPYPTMLDGQTLDVRRDNSFRMYTADQRVRTSNIIATNGVVHVSNRVMTP